MKKIIDYHYHVRPPEYIRMMNEHGIIGSTGIKFKKFDPKKNLKRMNRIKVDKAILSTTAPGVYVKNDRISASIARVCNDYIKTLIVDYPGRYGGFGVLPFPAIKESLTEMEYIFDSLKLDGVVFLTHVNGKYFGEPGYDELFHELNKRKAHVFIHPDDLLIHAGRYMAVTPFFERVIDTTRSAYNLLLNGYLEKYPDIRYILSHGGGGVPVMARRIVQEYMNRKKIQPDENVFDEKLSFLKNFYFDTAQRGQEIFNGLKEFCGSDHIVFGSDTPFVPVFEVIMNQKEIAGNESFSDREKERIYSGFSFNPQLSMKGA